jgi:cell division protein FtsQ
MSTVAVDPRIRQRRVAVARDAGRRRLRRLLVVAAILLVGLLALGLTWTPALDIEQVDVRGVEQTSVEAVTDAAEVAPGDPLAWFDTGAAEAAVEALPWVDEATVERDWSGAVTVGVTERVAVAALATADGAWSLADGEGRVLATVDTEPTDVARVEGVTISAPPGAQLDDEVLEALAVAAAVPPGIRAEVAAVQGSGAEVVVVLRAGGEIVLGGTDEIDAKLAAAAAVLANVSAACVDRLDVTLPAAPALVRVPGCV